ncbi:hypothetical protein Kisp01_48080 [Kineosporia sp. NBRC 101677]|uniref:hypothetical protein n=1 Tax=Kineosporia sp. NBRC 101677 TaxID=3032197 RepID=UPI0024A026A9|nr:hypothetical protein [Kineosporia sp. NBRC 101677]GLY17794.1 hypothetical protein Kisp01_48080 [Kineosporia sp. NBRC 101677]
MKLPPADPLLVAETIAGLPARLQKRLDAAVSGASGWQYADEVVDLGSAKVTLRPEQGALRRPENVLCDCLLAPGCLHRAAVLSVAPVLEAETPAPEPVESAGSPEGHQVGDRPSDPEVPPLVGAEEDRTGPPTSSIEQPDHPANLWKPTEQAVAQMIWDGAAQLLESGTVGAGAALQGQLLAGVHQARLRALHRLASATTRVVSGIRAARSDDASFSLPSLTADLLEVLAVAHVVISGRGGPDQWRGTARTVYQGVGGLRLAGLCMEPVTSAAGYAGVVVWLTDADGRLWSVSDVKPGDAERIPASASGPVAVGETGLSHRELTRAGMIMASATANPDGRLGSGNAVRAVRAAGVAWTEPQLAVRFGLLNGQAAEANSARSASARVPRLLSLTVCGSERDAILAVDDAGEGVRLVVPGGDHRQVHRENLRLLADKPGLRMLAVARPRPDDVNGSAAPARFLGLPATLELIAIGGGDLRLPAALNGHADLGFDRLSPRYLRPSGPPPPYPQAGEVTDPLLAYRRRLQRVVSGGRRTLSVPGVPQDVRKEAALLRREQLATAATLLEGLLAAAQPAGRDVFGRLAGGADDELARAWLAAGTYQRALLEAPQ